MGKLFRVHETAVCHHRPQRHQAHLSEEQPWKVTLVIKPHEATCDQPLRRRRQLRLAGVRTGPNQRNAPLERISGQGVNID